MNNLGKQIITNQNTEASIQLLASQKQLYSTAKFLFYVQCIFATVIPVLLAFVGLVFKGTQNFSWVFILYTILATLTEISLDQVVSNLKKKAASIQETFDCSVLDIRWNDVLLPEKPQPESIFRYYSKHIKNNSTEKLKDWYSIEIKSVDTNLATVICQRTNCTYDFSLRGKYSLSLVLIAVGTSVILFVLSMTTGMTVMKLVTDVIFPSLPVFGLMIKQYLANRDSIANLSSLKSLIASAFTGTSLTSVIDNNLIRQIQDKIYNNRILSPLLPDFVFRKFRGRLEDEMNYGAKYLIQNIRSGKATG